MFRTSDFHLQRTRRAASLFCDKKIDNLLSVFHWLADKISTTFCLFLAVCFPPLLSSNSLTVLK